MTLSWKHVTLLGVLGVTTIGAAAWLVRPLVLAYGWALLLVGALLLGQLLDYARARIRRARIIEVQGYPVDVRQLQDVSYTTVLQQIQPHPQRAPVVTSPTVPLSLPPPSYSAPQGLPAATWLALLNDQPDRVPHVAVIGPSGSGKTTLTTAILADRAGDVVILTAKEGDSWGGLPYVGIDDDATYSTAIQTFAALDVEIKARLVATKRGQMAAPWLSIVLDDFSTLVKEAPTAADVVKLVARLGRSLRVRLLMLSDSAHVKAIGLEGEGETRSNFAFVRLQRGHIATIDIDGEPQAIDLATVPQLATRPLDPGRVWSAATRPVIAPPAAPPLGGVVTNPDRIVAWLEANPGQHTAETISGGTGISKAVVWKEMTGLSERGRVQQHGTARNYTYSV